MSHRIGVCGACRARFQVPATFTHRQARCRTCGGVVEIGPVEGAAPAVPARAVEAPAAPVPAAPAPAAEVRVQREPDQDVRSAPAAVPERKPGSLLTLLLVLGGVALIVLGAVWLFG